MAMKMIPGGRADTAVKSIKSVGRAAGSGAAMGAGLLAAVTADSGNPVLNAAVGAGIGAIAGGVKDIINQSRGRTSHMHEGFRGARR
jgi:hypothetical protein